MRRLCAWWIRLCGLFNARQRAAAFDAELESHLEMHIDDNIRRGMTPEEARRQALIALGGAQTVRDNYRDRGGVPFLESLAQDVRFAVRMLRKSPGFTAVAVVVLAVGIGANGAVFSLVNAVLLKPIRGVRLDAPLVGLYSGERTRADAFRPFSYPEFVDLRDRNQVFKSLFAETVARPGLTENGITRRVLAGYVSSNYFSALGVSMAAGRSFTADEERPSRAAPVAVVSYGYWRRHGLRPDIVDRTMQVNGQTLTIVGVAEEGFGGTMPVLSTEFWLPFGAAGLVAPGEGVGAFERIAEDRSTTGLILSGTLARGISVDEAQARLAPLAAAMEAAYPQFNRDQRLIAFPRSRVAFGAQPRSNAGPLAGAGVLLALSAMVLAVACLNLANMLLARGSVRRREIAVRLALGGGRLRILRQLLVEGLLLSAMGGAAALGIAWWASARLAGSVSTIMEGAVSIDVAPDVRLLAVVGLASLLSAVCFGLGPALKLSRPELAAALKQNGPLPLSRRRRVTVPGLLVGAQVALSLTLVAAAGVFVRASANAAASDPGFALEGGVVASIDASLAGFDESDGRAVYARVLERVRALPGVRAASVASIVPFGFVQDDRQVRQGETSMQATFTVVGTDYFAALGLPVLAGREFAAAEEQQARAPIAIVDRLLAERLFPGVQAVGQSIRVSRGNDPDGELMEIVGIVSPVRDDILAAEVPHLYVPLGRHYPDELTLHVRTERGGEAAMLERVRTAIRDVDARLPVLSLRTLENHRDVSPSLWAVMLASRLFAALGTIALVLATVGIYGLRAYLVSQRTREIGIRMALGATRRGVVGLLLRETAAIAIAGMGTGLALALALVQVLRQSGMLYKVGAVDPLVFIAAPVLLAAAMAVASYIPARRALRIDPAVALRPE